jgi:hypothetical protein
LRTGSCRNPYPAHYRPAFACSPILYPQPHRLALRSAFPPKGGLRAYHVAPLKPRGLGPASTPVARHLRRGSSEPPDLATCLLAQASQHLWLVLCDDADGGSPGLTVPRTPGPRPPWCWQSRPRLALRPPSRGMRIRCAEGSAPPRCQERTPR